MFGVGGVCFMEVRKFGRGKGPVASRGVFGQAGFALSGDAARDWMLVLFPQQQGQLVLMFVPS